ncbi:MAG: DUF2807 domain-containing protein [Spirochaetaceae bacterium]|nr:DUF2807 domain-containing protein [Spirochaetaceae bacterium]MCF7948523.1 DUF2807 domain-containing protein [Spirochaetia bacterium]MCF7951001.1 DUF2807 domain-containing protein [Spirochaetaceae bacterium]
MKTSNKILLAAVSALVVIAIISIISMRVLVDRAAEAGGNLSALDRNFDGKRISQEYDLEDFSRLQVIGGWNLTIQSGDTYRVSITFPEELQNHVKIGKNGEVLTLETTGLIDFRGAHFKAVVQMPDLEELRSEGGLSAKIQGFTGEALSIAGGGGVQITAENCRYKKLSLQLSGGIQGDFRDLSAETIHINGNGAVDLDLSLNGGALTGEINGAANIKVRGSVAKNSLRVHGVSNIEYIK